MKQLHSSSCKSSSGQGKHAVYRIGLDMALIL